MAVVILYVRLPRPIRQTLSLFTRGWNVWRHGGYAHITTSARAYRETWLGEAEDRAAWAERMDRIDARLPGDGDVPHCESAWNGRVARAYQTIDEDQRIREIKDMRRAR